ncbi:MAG TPA: hypothetical protein VIO11_02560 [Candidatus Methanoperedens sp.]
MKELELEEKKRDLQVEIESFIRKYHFLKNVNFYINVAMIIGSLSLAAIVSYASFTRDSYLAGVLSIGLFFLISINNAFSTGEKAEFYQIIVVESENLLSTLKFEEEDFDTILKKFLIIRESAAKSIPRGRGMGIVKDVYKDLKRLHSP